LEEISGLVAKYSPQLNKVLNIQNGYSENSEIERRLSELSYNFKKSSGAE